MDRTKRHRLLLIAVLATATLVPLSGEGAGPPCDYVVSVNSDYYVSGRVAVAGVMPPWSVDDPVATIHSDADARYYNGLVYVINHLYGDNIQVLDPSQDFATILQFSVGPGSNPQDIAFVSESRAYVSRNESAILYEVDPTTGAITDSVDLSALADADGLPEMSGMALRGGLLFVAVQRLDRDYYWTPVPPSYLAVIDTATNELMDIDLVSPGVQGIELPATNPYRDILVDEDTGLLYVACSGSWGSLDGGIVEVDPVTLEAVRFVSTEAQLGGDLYDFTLPVSGRAHAVVSTSSPSWEQFCVAFDWSTGEKLSNVWKPGGYSVMDVEVHEGSGQLFLADRTYASPGIRIFDVSDGYQLTTGPIMASLPPHDLLVVGDEITAVAPDGDHAAFHRLSAYPNPCNDSCALALQLPGPDRVRAAVYDVMGRLVCVLADRSFPAGEVLLAWNGRDERGDTVASAVYFVRMRVGASELERKIVLLR